MELSQEYIEDNIFISQYTPPATLKAQEGVLCLVIEPTVEFDAEADDILKRLGFAPFYDRSPDCDLSGWYAYLAVCVKDRLLGVMLEPWGTEQDVGEAYELPMDAGTKERIFNHLKSLVGEEEWGEAFL